RNQSIVALLLALVVPICAAQTTADASRWYVTGALGTSLISDPSSTYTLPGGPTGSGKFKLGSGLMAGGSVGWYLRPDWRIEADYNYRTNKLSTTSVPGLDAAQSDADYASVLIMANVLKDFDGWSTSWATFKPYVGAGLGIAQEVDTDVNIGGVQREFSGNRSAWQLLAGVNWQYRSPWFAGVSVRYVNAGTVRLNGSAAGLGEIRADYKGLGLDARLGYRF
ncbi:MAG: outer membrane protein, partial [Burkholderiaceae bacterium]